MHSPRTSCIPSMICQCQKLLHHKQWMWSWMLLSWLHCHYLFSGLGKVIVICQNITEICFLNHTCLYLLRNAGSPMEKGHKFLSLLTFQHLVIYRAAYCAVHYPPGHSRIRLIPMAYFSCMTMTPSQKMIQKIYLMLLAIWTFTWMQTPSIHIQTKAHCCWKTGTGTRGWWSWESVLTIVGSSDFWPEDIWDTEWTKINCELRTLGAPDELTSMPENLMEWLYNDAGWKNTPVKISVPFPCCSAKPGPVAYSVHNFYHCSLISVICEKVIDSWNHHAFHYEPYTLHWNSPHKTCEIGVHSELFTSKSFLNAHNQLQSSPHEPGCDLPHHIIALMFWSNATQLMTFGDVKLWPLYMHFRNESKYARCKPSAYLCNHITYFQTVCYCFTGKWFMTDILVSSLTTSKTLCSIISKTSNLAMPSLPTSLGIVPWPMARNTWQRICLGIPAWNDSDMCRLHSEVLIYLIFTYSADYPEK